MPDLMLNLFLSLGGHVDLLTTASFINPLPGHVENKAAFAERYFPSTVTFDNASACVCPRRKVPGWKQPIANAMRLKAVVR
jgi:hypothetical protein